MSKLSTNVCLMLKLNHKRLLDVKIKSNPKFIISYRKTKLATRGRKDQANNNKTDVHSKQLRLIYSERNRNRLRFFPVIIYKTAWEP